MSIVIMLPFCHLFKKIKRHLFSVKLPDKKTIVFSLLLHSFQHKITNKLLFSMQHILNNFEN